jgi:tRNA-binding protein
VSRAGGRDRLQPARPRWVGPVRDRKTSLAKRAPDYEGSEVVGSLVLSVVTFPPGQIGQRRFEVLIRGVPDEEGTGVLVRLGAEVPIGGRLD